MQRTTEITRKTMKTTIQTIKVITKTTITIIKSIITAIRSLISAIIAGGWIAIIIVVVICSIAMICSSIFGIFFLNEKDISSKSMNSVIKEINLELTNKITEIEKNVQYDEYEVNYNIANWKDILLLYTVIISNGKEQSDVIILNNKRISELKKIFWEMNIITSSIEEVDKDIEVTDEENNIKIERKKIKILHINITNKSLQEMVDFYNLNNKQREQLIELQKDEYNSMWSYLLYGTQDYENNIVQVALSQVGNIGGEKFWSWYGFKSRVEWCAIFVSWCAEQCGYINSGIIPRFASCDYGVNFFRSNGTWKEKNYTPAPGDIIFFDWDVNGIVDHVGIVEKILNGSVYTIEGNANDKCQQLEYKLNSNIIFGYGTIN